MTTMALDLELSRLIVAARAGDERAREQLVERFTPLVRSLAARYAGRGEPIEDLVQVGSIGLLLALDRFDLDRGVRFTSYAVPTILGEMQRHFRDRTWSVHVPRRMKELAYKLNRTIESITSSRGRPPTIGELAETTGLSHEVILEALETYRAYSARSLSQPRSSHPEDGTMQDALGTVEAGYEDVEQTVIIEAGLAGLDERERRIVQLRFYEGLTQSEIAALLGISQMHVSRLLRRALMVMRGRLEATEIETGSR